MQVNPELRVDLLVYIEKHCIETSKPVPQIISNAVIQATAEGLNLLCERYINLHINVYLHAALQKNNISSITLERQRLQPIAWKSFYMKQDHPSRRANSWAVFWAKTSYAHALTLKNLVEWPLWPPLLKAYSKLMKA